MRFRLGLQRADESLLKRALELIPDDFFGELSDKGIEKEIEAIDKLIEQKKSEIIELSPPEFFEFNDAQVGCDMREVFVRQWCDTQRCVKKPCNPLGYDLEISEQPEKDAYHSLKINESISPKAHKLPHPGVNYIDLNSRARAG